MTRRNNTLESRIRQAIADELRRRHGYGMMEEKIKPVHLANALLRESHHKVGELKDIVHLMAATAPRADARMKQSAVDLLLERSRDRWGRLSEPIHRDALQRRVLPLLRRLLASDGAAYGLSPDKSSFSVPTAGLATPDISDEHAGQMVFRLWSGAPDLADPVLVPVLRAVCDPKLAAEQMDDLTAVLSPLSSDTRDRKPRSWDGQDLTAGYSPIEQRMRSAARDLERFELAARANPIAALQRIVLLASLTLFTHASTRAQERGGASPVPLLIDASDLPSSSVAEASTRLVAQVLRNAEQYMALTLSQLIGTARNFEGEPIESVVARAIDAEGSGPRVRDALTDCGCDAQASDFEVASSLLSLLEGRSLSGFVRSLGWRSGFFYPVEKNPRKRVVPTDRTLEVLVLSTFDVTGRPLEFREFLDSLYERWGLVCGGRTEDAVILERAGETVGSHELGENGDRFLSRLESIGLARRFADSVAVVGTFGAGGDHAGH